ncbi:hypothetical protein [Pandoraea sp. ISTKB]|uniref:hypothetical protein n=1 Tax=Pandoraea sp. ISTKB TaxID=1586708 RepID=UPI00084748B3|nr:hypothetical protein [Pandoraea sp. ISTKB]ODP34704.1 hypothetical protein A9762_13925 [Pandoraea sp. ISTKB]
MRISGSHSSSTHHSGPSEPSHGPSGSQHGSSGAHGTQGGKHSDSGMDIPPIGGKSGAGGASGASGSDVTQALDQMILQLGQNMLSNGKKWAAQLKADNDDS